MNNKITPHSTKNSVNLLTCTNQESITSPFSSRNTIRHLNSLLLDDKKGDNNKKNGLEMTFDNYKNQLNKKNNDIPVLNFSSFKADLKNSETFKKSKILKSIETITY